MSVQPPLADSTRPQSVDFARQQIERLVSELLVGKTIDGITFVEELLAIAREVGEVHCSPAENHGLRFELCGGGPFEIVVDGNRGKLRMLCARLAVLCQESGHDFMPYGGEGILRRSVNVDSASGASEQVPVSVSWKVRWDTTPGHHEFTIQSAER